MKMKDKLKSALKHGPVPDSEDGMICYAYYAGREAASKKLCDEYKRRVSAMCAQAERERYYYVAHRVIDAGGGDSIYSPDYAGDVTATFGDDQV